MCRDDGVRVLLAEFAFKAIRARRKGAKRERCSMSAEPVTSATSPSTLRLVSRIAPALRRMIVLTGVLFGMVLLCLESQRESRGA